MIHKIYFFLTFLVLLNIPVFAQKQYIFVWDVTSSMIGVTNTSAHPSYGYSKDKDIFEAVKTNIINHINSFQENIGDIYIIPFRERVLSVLKFELTAEGKEIAKNYVSKQSLKNSDGNPDPAYFSSTNICGAFVEAMNHIDIKNETVIYLYTDGEQNVNYGSKGTDCLRDVIYSYCNKYNGINVFTFLISLNNSLSKVNLDLSKACGNIQIFNIRDGGSIANISFIKIKPSLSPLYYNLVQKHNSARQTFEIDGGALPGDFTYDAVFTYDNHDYSLTLKDINNLKIINGASLFQINSSTRVFPNVPIHGKIKLINPRTGSNSILRFQPDEFDIEISPKEPARIKITGFEDDK